MNSQNEIVSLDVMKILEQLGIDLHRSQLQCGIPSQAREPANAASQTPSMIR